MGLVMEQYSICLVNIVLDQIRALDKRRAIKKLGKLSPNKIFEKKETGATTLRQSSLYY
jgi:mRNA-degrading endonuclease toxin of MazEF toxin-antitoxin module